MRYLPNVLLVFALPAGAVGYLVGARVLEAIAPSLAGGVVGLFVPLFVGGLCMVPFFLPFLDRRAKADLAVIRARRAAEEAEAGDAASAGAGVAPGKEPRPASTPGGRPKGRA